MGSERSTTAVISSVPTSLDATRQVGRANLFERLLHRRLQGGRLVVQPQAVAEQHGCRQDGADGIGDALSGDVGCRAVDRLVQSLGSTAAHRRQRRRRQQAEGTGEDRGLVGEDVAEEVACQQDVEVPWS